MPRIPNPDQKALVQIVPANTKFQYDENGRPICGALTRNGGKCANAPKENGRCRMHGGNSPKGAMSPHFRHGLYSKYLPKTLGQRLDELAANPMTHDLREQTAILDAVMISNLQEWAAGGGGVVWEDLNKKRTEYMRATARKDTRLMVQIVNEVMEIIVAGHSKLIASRELRETVEDRRKITESERRRRIEEKSMIPVEQVVTVLVAIGDSIRRHIRDEDARNAVVSDVSIAMGSVMARQHEAHVQNQPYEDEV